jgi:hypothetical protein
MGGIVAGIVALLILIACLMLAGGGCSHRGSSETPPPVAVSAKGIALLDRTAIQTMLKKLAETPAPERLSFGAMCYEMALPPTRADYVCPKCGERTLYGDSTTDTKGQLSSGAAMVVDEEISACRREVQELHRLAGDAVTLDESQFCRKCSPTVTDPKLVVHINFNDGDARDIENISAMDLRLLREFMEGKRLHKGEQDRETPLKDSLPRLQEILGVELTK